MTDMERHLNIIAFNIPWPANYGGIIDVYYKMKAPTSVWCKDHLTLFRIRTRTFTRTGSHLRKGILLQAAYGVVRQHDPVAL